MNNITMNPFFVCLKVQKYLKDKYNIDFLTSRTRIFPLALNLKGRYEDERLVTCEQFAEDLYDEYVRGKK